MTLALTQHGMAGVWLSLNFAAEVYFCPIAWPLSSQSLKKPSFTTLTSALIQSVRTLETPPVTSFGHSHEPTPPKSWSLTSILSLLNSSLWVCSIAKLTSDVLLVPLSKKQSADKVHSHTVSPFWLKLTTSLWVTELTLISMLAVSWRSFQSILKAC